MKNYIYSSRYQALIKNEQRKVKNVVSSCDCSYSRPTNQYNLNNIDTIGNISNISNINNIRLNHNLGVNRNCISDFNLTENYFNDSNQCPCKRKRRKINVKNLNSRNSRRSGNIINQINERTKYNFSRASEKRDSAFGNPRERRNIQQEKIKNVLAKYSRKKNSTNTNHERA